MIYKDLLAEITYKNQAAYPVSVIFNTGEHILSSSVIKMLAKVSCVSEILLITVSKE